MDTRDPMMGLRVAFKHLRKARTLSPEDTALKVLVSCDALELLKAAEQRDDQQVLSLYKGSFLEGFYLKDISQELEEWVVGTREYLASLFRQATLRLGESAATKGDARLAAHYAEQAYTLAAAPPPEPKQLELIYSLLVAGKNPRASQLYKDFEDLGMPPSLTPREASVLTANNPQAYSFGLRTTHNLPPLLTSFVGRQEELKDLKHYLRTPRHRLITLIGPGGIGKTRLSLELAYSQLELDYWEGIYFVPLESLQDPNLVLVQLANTLGYRLEGHDPLLKQLIRLIGQKPLLLILDNFEHLISGASVLAELIPYFPYLKIIVTSRERLNLAAEAVYEVEGLPLSANGVRPSLEGQHLEAAIELFVQRAQQANLRFQLTPQNLADIARICRLLEGIPLALELAAAWVRGMSLSDISQELATNPSFLTSQQQDALERHKSLRTVFEHSWALLKPIEQEALQKLSVFQGGFRREAAAKVTDTTLPVLASLVDKSLLHKLPSGRYDRHMLLYEFAREKLAGNPDLEQSCEAHHAHYFLSLAEQGEIQLRQTNQSLWLKRLDEEEGNFRAALCWSLEQQALDMSLRLVGSLGLYWYLRSSFEQGRSWFEQVLSQPNLPQNTHHTKVLNNAGRLARSYGDFAQAQALLEKCLGLCQHISDDQGAVKSLNELGIVAAVQTSYEKAERYFQQGLELASSIHDEEGLGLILSNQGFLHTILGSFATAQQAFEQSLAINQKRGDNHGRAHVLNNLALVSLRQDAYAEALTFYQESFDLSQGLEDNQTMAESLWGMGMVCNQTNDYLKAKVYLKQSLKLYVDLRKTPDIIDVLFETARLAKNICEPRLALQLWGLTDSLRKRLNFPLSPFEQTRYDHDRITMQTQVTAKLFQEMQTEGSLWSLDEGVQKAFAWLDTA
jgi:predicted ATPase